MAVWSLGSCEFQQIEFFDRHFLSSFRNHKTSLSWREGIKGRGICKGSPPPAPSLIKGGENYLLRILSF